MRLNRVTCEQNSRTTKSPQRYVANMAFRWRTLLYSSMILSTSSGRKCLRRRSLSNGQKSTLEEAFVEVAAAAVDDEGDGAAIETEGLLTTRWTFAPVTTERSMKLNINSEKYPTLSFSLEIGIQRICERINLTRKLTGMLLTFFEWIFANFWIIDESFAFK